MPGEEFTPMGRKLSANSLTIGYFPNITHATALVGLQKGFFAKELRGTRLKTQVFNAGPSAMEALNAGAVDIAWVGPAPAVNGFVRSKGRSLRILSGSASGGASLVVNPDRIGSPADVRGRRIATPQIGGTQDTALLHWAATRGWRVDPQTGDGGRARDPTGQQGDPHRPARCPSSASPAASRSPSPCRCPRS